MTTDLVLRSSRVITPTGMRPATIVVRAGKIVDVTDANAAGAEDVGDLLIMPGLVESELLARRPVQPTAEILAKALQPVDVAEAVLAVAQLPARVVVPEMQILPTLL